MGRLLALIHAEYKDQEVASQEILGVRTSCNTASEREPLPKLITGSQTSSWMLTSSRCVTFNMHLSLTYTFKFILACSVSTVLADFLGPSYVHRWT